MAYSNKTKFPLYEDNQKYYIYKKKGTLITPKNNQRDQKKTSQLSIPRQYHLSATKREKKGYHTSWGVFFLLLSNF